MNAEAGSRVLIILGMLATVAGAVVGVCILGAAISELAKAWLP